jgi:hypothetical protein
MVRKLLVLVFVGCLAFVLCRVQAGGDKQPAKTAVLPEGLRHVPSDALVFVHFRLADFLATDLGQTLQKELAKHKEMATFPGDLTR